MQHKERIGLEDNMLSAIAKVSDGNPGAIVAMTEMIKASAITDPDSILGPFTPILGLDTYGIYGSHIHLLFVDSCKKSPYMMLGLLRACQMGFIDVSELHKAVQTYTPIPMSKIEEVITKLKSELPNFDSQNNISFV